MTDSASMTVIRPDDDPLGAVSLESEVAFGVRSAALTGAAPGLTDYWEITTHITCTSLNSDRTEFGG